MRQNVAEAKEVLYSMSGQRDICIKCKSCVRCWGYSKPTRLMQSQPSWTLQTKGSSIQILSDTASVPSFSEMGKIQTPALGLIKQSLSNSVLKDIPTYS